MGKWNYDRPQVISNGIVPQQVHKAAHRVIPLSLDAHGV